MTQPQGTQAPPIHLLMDTVASRITQFGTGGQYAPSTPNSWRKASATPKTAPSAPKR